ncbi:hypothetical protein [Magnetospira sp. QH-2]|uniref:hypothetical protein n=1 Tax=Magnetospira sp. (strain QH-2) TaxID=1288970 RepID=UPI0011DE4FF8|nr:hypothetical protein [Magnetospira sp. QH-2]
MMKRLVVGIALLTTSACSGPWEPLVDLKASEDETARTMQEDLMECEWLTDRYGDGDEQEVRRCMQGRGHSVLN